MNNLKDKYKVTETFSTLSFKPFAHYKKGLKWYVLSILILGGLLFVYFNQFGDAFKTIGSGILIVVVIFLLKELVIYLPVKYTFDKSENAVYQSNILFSKRKIMNLDEVVVFRSSEMGSWHFSMGPKRRQFVKNYTISENFGSGKKSDEKALAFETEIIEKIYLLSEV